MRPELSVQWPLWKRQAHNIHRIAGRKPRRVYIECPLRGIEPPKPIKNAESMKSVSRYVETALYALGVEFRLPAVRGIKRYGGGVGYVQRSELAREFDFGDAVTSFLG